MDVFVHHIPAKYIDRLNEPDKSRLEGAIDGLEEDPPEGDIRPMSGQKGMFRLKIGGYRILFRYREKDILVTHIRLVRKPSIIFGIIAYFFNAIPLYIAYFRLSNKSIEERGQVYTKKNKGRKR